MHFLEQLELYKKYGKDTTEIQRQIDQINLSKKTSPLEQDKKNYDNALGLIEQYYNSLELNILQNIRVSPLNHHKNC